MENIFEELDSPGEWFLNRKTHLLYFYPPAGVDLKTATVEATRLRTLIDRLPLADRNRLLSIAGVLDQIVRLAGEQDERPDVRSGK